LAEDVEIGQRDCVRIQQRVRPARVVAAPGATNAAVDDEMRDMDALWR